MSCNAASTRFWSRHDHGATPQNYYTCTELATRGRHLHSERFRSSRDRESHPVQLGRYTDARADEGCRNPYRRDRLLSTLCAVRHTQAGLTRTTWRQWIGSMSDAVWLFYIADMGSIASRDAREGGLRNLSSRPCKWWVAALKCVGGGQRDRQLKCLAWRPDHDDVQRARDHRETRTRRPEQRLRMGLHEHVVSCPRAIVVVPGVQGVPVITQYWRSCSPQHTY